MPIATWTGRKATPEAAAADISAALGDELGLPDAPSATTLPAESTGVPAGSLLPPRERFSGMPAATHCFVYVDARTPRPFELRAAVLGGRSLIRRSLGLGLLLYAVPLTMRPLPSPVGLSTTSGSTPALFEGDPAAANGLNSNAQLLATARALTPTTAGPDRHHSWQVARRLTIEPLPHGAVLLVQTLHRATPRAWSLGAARVLDFAAGVEAALG
ncbi:hypothetical protein K2224_20385 [Streptomyces sp. BHT-5-2]|uniref:hypothetical protein n=1 Tax=unclassified Streptomyces TaxID=2593676 RepID=UPI001C8E71D0|nr:hypothetical protein [Streptomyces sp. BHT-5-2]QZL05207.1 hypothetical protein K2224_20385 [Streptomyces sp. BHT-5-2]